MGSSEWKSLCFVFKHWVSILWYYEILRLKYKKILLSLLFLCHFVCFNFLRFSEFCHPCLMCIYHLESHSKTNIYPWTRKTKPVEIMKILNYFWKIIMGWRYLIRPLTTNSPKKQYLIFHTQTLFQISYFLILYKFIRNIPKTTLYIID